MIKKTHRVICLLLVLTVGWMLAGCSNSLETSDSASTEVVSDSEIRNVSLGYAEEIDKTQIMTFAISVDETEWQTMLDNAADKEYIPADITINGTTIENVGIRPKGNSSLSAVVRDDTTDRYSFKIKFDEYVEDQTWLGLDKIVLNSNFSDATSLKEYLSYDIMSYIGVDAPLFAFADISLNGETWGFYLAVEEMDSGYRDRVFNGEGEMYKPESEMGAGGFGGGQMPEGMNGERPMPEGMNGERQAPMGAAGEQGMPDGADGAPAMPEGEEGNWPDFDGVPPMFGQDGEDRGGMGGMRGMSANGVSLQYTDDEIDSYSAIFDNAETKTNEEDHQRVIEALKNLSEGNDLETYVDVDAVLRYFAAHTVVVNLDSYVSNMGHNYYLYENDGQISILPWDYNLAFGGFQAGSASSVVNFPIDTPVSGIDMEERPLLAKLLEVPEYLDTYHQYLQEIVDGYFADGKFEQTIDQMSALMDEYVKNDPTAFYTYEEFTAGVAELKKLGVLRAESIQGQLDGTIPSTTEAQQQDDSALIDASSVNLQALGSQGGGGGGRGGQGGPPGFRNEQQSGEGAA